MITVEKLCGKNNKKSKEPPTKKMEWFLQLNGRIFNITIPISFVQHAQDQKLSYFIAYTHLLGVSGKLFANKNTFFFEYDPGLDIADIYFPKNTTEDNTNWNRPGNLKRVMIHGILR